MCAADVQHHDASVQVRPRIPVVLAGPHSPQCYIFLTVTEVLVKLYGKRSYELVIIPPLQTNGHLQVQVVSYTIKGICKDNLEPNDIQKKIRLCA